MIIRLQHIARSATCVAGVWRIASVDSAGMISNAFCCVTSGPQSERDGLTPPGDWGEAPRGQQARRLVSE